MRGISTTIIGGPEYRANMAKDFADQVMTRQVEFETRKEKIKDFNDGRSSDIVIDTAGTSKALSQSVEYVRKGGTIVEIGGFYHASDNSISPEDLVFEDLYVVGQYGYPPIEYSKSLDLLKDVSDRYDIGKLVTHELNLEELENLTDKDFYREKEYMKIAVNPQR
jgi:L-iditol 2-dehydrogenase